MTPVNPHDSWDARDYEQNSAAQLVWAHELIDTLHLGGTEHVLDVGCGDGKITRLIADRLPAGRVTGIDRSEAMIALAVSRHRKQNLSFQLMDATAIVFEPTFDIAFSNAALHWIADHPAVLSGISNALREGGRLVMQMGGKENAWQVVEVIEELITTEEWHHYYSRFRFPYFFYDVHHYEQWLPDYGFTPESIRRVPKDMVHQSAEQFKGWLRTTWFPYTDVLPENLREQFLEQAVGNYLKKCPLDDSGRSHTRMVRLEVCATKNRG